MPSARGEPQNWYAVSSDFDILRAKNHAFEIGLRNEHTVEGICVMAR